MVTAANARQRGTCPLCGHSIRVRLDGRLRTHGATAERLARGSNFCKGSWTKVAEPRVSNASPAPRGICPGCGVEYALRADGRVRTHGLKWPGCPGSGQLPEATP